MMLEHIILTIEESTSENLEKDEVFEKHKNKIRIKGQKR